MSPKLTAVSLAFVFGSALTFGQAAMAEATGTHKVFLPQDIKWNVAPPSLPAGAEAAVLYGNPAGEGLFALRLKVPKGYHIPPHTHPKPEAITIISGKLRIGLGSKALRTSGDLLPAGSFTGMQEGVAHYVFVDEDSVVQINAIGPWGIDYLDPRDDPRLNIAPSQQEDRRHN